MRLDICLASDDNYAKYMGTTIASILDNSKDDEEIYFHLIDGGITEENKNKILSLKKIKKCTINFIEPKKEIFKYISKYQMKSYSTWFRLQIPSLIDADKVLYLDSDIIVNKDLRELFLDDDLENYYAFAIEDVMDKIDDVKRGINFKKEDKYFNAGFLMINNKLWKEDKLEEKFHHTIKELPILGYKDQDILNYCLKDRVKFIDKKWNFLDYKFCYRNVKPNLTDINIIHCVTKPWKENCNSSFFKDEFWKYYQLTPWFFERPIDAIQTILAQKYSDYEDTKLKINDIRAFGIYHNRNTLQIVFFFIKITIEMNFKNVNKIAWFIPIKKYREAFKRAFDV